MKISTGFIIWYFASNIAFIELKWKVNVVGDGRPGRQSTEREKDFAEALTSLVLKS